MKESIRTFGLGFLAALALIFSVGMASAGLNATSTTTASYTNGQVYCSVLNNNDGTIHFGCDLPSADAQVLSDGLAAAYGYSETIEEPDGTTIANPESKAEFNLRVGLYSYMRDHYVAQKVREWEASRPGDDFGR